MQSKFEGAIVGGRDADVRRKIEHRECSRVGGKPKRKTKKARKCQTHDRLQSEDIVCWSSRSQSSDVAMGQGVTKSTPSSIPVEPGSFGLRGFGWQPGGNQRFLHSPAEAKAFEPPSFYITSAGMRGLFEKRVGAQTAVERSTHSKD